MSLYARLMHHVLMEADMKYRGASPQGIVSVPPNSGESMILVCDSTQSGYEHSCYVRQILPYFREMNARAFILMGVNSTTFDFKESVIRDLVSDIIVWREQDAEQPLSDNQATTAP